MQRAVALKAPGAPRRVLRAAVSAVSSLFGAGAAPPARRAPSGAPGDFFPGAWQRGSALSPLGELTAFGAVYACLDRISSDVGKLQPLLLYWPRDSAVPTPAFRSYPEWKLFKKPNSFQTWQQFITLWVLMKLLYGNAYIFKEVAEGVVRALYVLDSRKVIPMVTMEGDVYYSVGGDDLARLPSGGAIPARFIIHDRAATLWHPLIGVSPLTACAYSASQGLRIQENSATFFQNMSRPSGILTAPATIDEETVARLKRDWEANYTSGNIGKLAVLGDGLTYQAMTISAEAAQMVEQLEWTAKDVARAFKMPFYKIDPSSAAPGGGSEAMQIQYYSDCLQADVEAIENLLTANLGLREDLTVELDVEGLIRMDTKTRVDALAVGVGSAIYKPDEARAKLNLPPVVGGDQVYLQQQNYSLAALARRDARPDPFAPATAAPAAPPEDPPAPEGADAETDDAAKAFVDALCNGILTRCAELGCVDAARA